MEFVVPTSVGIVGHNDNRMLAEASTTSFTDTESGSLGQLLPQPIQFLQGLHR